MCLCQDATIMIRTTVRLDENLFKEARKMAIDKRIAFTDIVHEALSLYLGKPKGTQRKKLTGTEFLGRLIVLGKKYHIKGPKDLAKNHDKYLWE